MNQLKNYKVVYVRKFENVVVAMRKMGKSAKARKPTHVFYGVASDQQKKAALKGLEPVYLEPPRRAKKSRKMKFLPDLLKDSLVGYPRRVFISDDSSTLEWFYKNYPTRDQEFQVYDLANGGKTSKPIIPLLENRKAAHQGKTGVSGWLAKHVRREDYVVMKAEARMVEEMLKDKTINLVDELFLECNHQWQHGGGENGSKRPYWQCLSLYGKVRDEGIAVHQWWG